MRKLDGAVREGLNLNDDDVARMATLTHHRLATIYTEAHALAFATDPMYSEMRTRIAGEFGEEFLQLGKPSINQQAKVALARLAHGNDDLRRKMFSEFATYITRSKDDNANEETFRDFEDTMMKPSELWTLCDDSDYSSIKHLLSAVHRNPAGASGGERNHKLAKQVHSRLRARLGAAKVETGTAIHFNAKQLLRKMDTTRSTRFFMWLQRLGSPFLAAAKDHLAHQNNMTIDEDIDDNDSDAVDNDTVENDIDEFNHLNLTGGVDTIADEDIFALTDEEQDQLNAFNGSGTDVCIA